MPKGKKRGRPKKLDTKKDFDKPTRKQEQGTLELKLAAKEPDKLVRNKRMQVVYVKPHFDRNKKGNRYVALEVSAVVTKEHDGLLPGPIAAAYSDIAKKNRKRVDLINLKQQAGRFYLTHDDPEPHLNLLAARLSHVSLQVIEEKGTGTANKVIRLSFRLRVPLSREVAHFSEWTFGDAYWMKMEEAQGHLLEDEDEEEVEESEVEEEIESEEEVATDENTAPPAEETGTEF